MSVVLRTSYEHRENFPVTAGKPERKQSAVGETGRPPKLGAGGTKAEVSKRGPSHPQCVCVGVGITGSWETRGTGQPDRFG